MHARARQVIGVVALTLALITALVASVIFDRDSDQTGAAGGGTGGLPGGPAAGPAGASADPGAEATAVAEPDASTALEAGGAGDGEGPTALSAHLEALREAVPGKGGEEGPGSAELQAYLAHAYPAKTISMGKLQGSARAFRVAQARVPAPGQRLAAGARWVRVGPRRALYPLTRFRNASTYVPNKYIAGGRTTSIALSNVCRPGKCRMWITPAGGGVWRTENAFAARPRWKYLAGPLGIQAAGQVVVDPNDPSGNTIYLGTGEANICASGCVAGVGLYKSTNGGNTWTGPLGRKKLGGKGIGSIVVTPGRPKVIYVGTTTALRGYSSVCCDGVTRPVPGAAKWGLYKSTDGGRSWRFIHNGSRRATSCRGDLTEYANNGACSPRGVRQVVLDPGNPNIVYASSYARGIWRSSDAGAHWVQIKKSINARQITSRASIAVTKLAGGKTRMYVYEGNIGDPPSQLFRSDDVSSGRPKFKSLTSADPADPGYGTYNQCAGQCWYDEFVYTPKGHPNIVYTGGSYAYDETGGISNGRAVMLSTNAGVSSTDMTMDATDRVHPNGLHPDQHSIVTDPRNPFRFFETSDGGVVRSNGKLADASASCAARGLKAPELRRCRQLLSRVPARLQSLNRGLDTLQFQSLSVSPTRPHLLMGGTQDNGTWQTYGNKVTWRNIMIGDGGQSGFAIGRPRFRFHTFFDASVDVNFNNGHIANWIWTGDPIFGLPGNQFYVPVISDPRVSGTMFVGTGLGVYRTKTFGLGKRTLAKAEKICNEWTGTFARQCGDWRLTGRTSLTSGGFGSRPGGGVSAVERTKADTSTAWAATTTGRVFVSKNVAAKPASEVRWNRVDNPFLPNRFVSSIYVDPTDGNRAWVSYSGYNRSTPTTPGHVFRVVYHPRTGKATWTNLSYNLGDVPVTDLVRDQKTGDLYASTDFGVLRLAGGSRSWARPAPGMPSVAVPGLTIKPRSRLLYAASHGLGAWRLSLR